MLVEKHWLDNYSAFVAGVLAAVVVADDATVVAVAVAFVVVVAAAAVDVDADAGMKEGLKRWERHYWLAYLMPRLEPVPNHSLRGSRQHNLMELTAAALAYTDYAGAWHQEPLEQPAVDLDAPSLFVDEHHSDSDFGDCC